MTVNSPSELFERPVSSTSVVLLVDKNDNEIGVADKIEAHINGGKLHRAFSIFVFDNENRLILQKRAASKYHFGGLWTNTCCGHALPGEDIAKTASIRLWQEMKLCVQLNEVGLFRYVATDSNSSLTEREIDHIFIGFTNDLPQPDPSEADSWQKVSLENLRILLKRSPETFTPWFPLAFKEIETILN
jgi:isopentenyl-diphosphate delta-isomerase